MSRRQFLKRAPTIKGQPVSTFFNDQEYIHSCQCSEILCPLYMTGLNRRCPPPCESFCVLCCSQTLCLDSVVRVEDCRSVARPSPLPYVLPPLVFVIFNLYLVCSQTDSSFFLTQKALFTTFELQHWSVASILSTLIFLLFDVSCVFLFPDIHSLVVSHARHMATLTVQTDCTMNIKFDEPQSLDRIIWPFRQKKG